MRTRSVLLLLVALLATMLLPASADAAGRRWPGRTLTYFDASRDPVAVAGGVRAWNSTGIGIRFVRTRVRARAQLVIRNSRDVPAGCGTGLASLGYTRGRQAFVNIQHGFPGNGQACSVYGQTLVVAHELGHVLGLAHDSSRCSLMNTSHTGGVAPSLCYGPFTLENTSERRTTWRCRIVEPIDRARARRMYGGTLRPARVDPWCALLARIDAPAPLTAVWDTVERAVVLTMRRPIAPTLLPFLAPVEEEKYELYGSSTGCVTTRPAFGSAEFNEHAIAKMPWTVAPGADEPLRDVPANGHWCYTAWALDSQQRASLVPATVEVDVTEILASTRTRARTGRAGLSRSSVELPAVTRFDHAK